MEICSELGNTRILSSGMPCVAPYEDAGVEQFYRAKIINIDRNDAEVLFIDYGNINLVPLAGLKYLPQVFKNIENIE